VLLFSQVLGALWYLLSVDRQTACWKTNCRDETGCNIKFLDCDGTPDSTWANITTIFRSCNASNSTITFDFGMFLPALKNQAPAERFVMKYFYSLWWGLQNLRYFLFPKHTFSYLSQLKFLVDKPIIT
jgi:cyclic nucleotide gated channel